MKKEYTAPKIEKLDFDETATTAVISSVTQEPIIEDDNVGGNDDSGNDSGNGDDGNNNGCGKTHGKGSWRCN